MLTSQNEQLLRNLRAGSVDSADIVALEHGKASDLLAELASDYRLRYQERRLGKKWEMGLACSLQYRLTTRVVHDSFFPTMFLIPVLRKCLFVSGEDDRVTGLAATTGLAMRPTRRPPRGLALTTGSGFKLEQAPDGWAVKPLKRRTVKLTEEFLQRRGWQFGFLWQLVRRP